MKWEKYLIPALWLSALVFLFFMDPEKKTASFCFFKFLGFKSCPGCGIGHSIHYVLHFNIIKSLHEHYLGIPATIGIFYNIFNPLIIHNKKTIST
ncbi:MAG: DUF2752 domain-containing protein [Bacteroidia bacterium]